MQDQKITKENIYDIYEITPASWFPFSLNVNITLIITIILIFCIYQLLLYIRRKRKSWQYQASKKIQEMLKNDKIKIKDLYELIKKISLKKYERENIAKLDNEKLFDFLAMKNQFPWQNQKIYFNKIYSKTTNEIESKEIKHILIELKKWL